MKINRDAYLQRFRATDSDKTIEHLSELQSLHMRHVPFENLDVLRKKPIYLNMRNFYEKIVTKQRGGYCYEVNGLFYWLLTALGYQAHLAAATVKRPNGQYAKADTHVVIIVELDQTYLVDVGFGNSPHHPVPLGGARQEDISGTYKIDWRAKDQFHLVKKEAADWRTLYKFNTKKKDIVDFHEGCIFNQVSEQSTFTHHDIVTIATDHGRITLTDRTLTTTIDGIKQQKEIAISQKKAVLETVFGINLT